MRSSLGIRMRLLESCKEAAFFVMYVSGIFEGN
jgi:hypothetical protein